MGIESRGGEESGGLSTHRARGNGPRQTITSGWILAAAGTFVCSTLGTVGLAAST